MDFETQAVARATIRDMQAISATLRANTVLSKLRDCHGGISGAVVVDAKTLALAVVALAETADIDLAINLLAESITNRGANQ